MMITVFLLENLEELLYPSRCGGVGRGSAMVSGRVGLSGKVPSKVLLYGPAVSKHGIQKVHRKDDSGRGTNIP